MRDRVYKYGPVSPSSPGLSPFGPEPGSLIIKYGPPESMWPKPGKIEFPAIKEVTLLSQAERSLAEVEKLLVELKRGVKPTKKLINKLRKCIGELGFLYVQLEDFSRVKVKKEKASSRRGREIVILYIMTMPRQQP